MGALSGKAVLLVTHQVDFLPAFDSILVSLILILDNISNILFFIFISGDLRLVGAN